jgi:polyhydroxyalkanoate synthesis repressor PhaR
LHCGAAGPILTPHEARGPILAHQGAPSRLRRRGLIVAEKTKDADAPGEATIIKKYANRRLYNTATSSYVTLDHLSEMVRAGSDFVVQDARTGEDITRAVLAQIIFEQESRSGQNLLPVQFLRKLIHFYGHQMQGFLPSYLDMSMENFSKSQEQWRDQLARAWGGKMPIAAFEDMTRQNMALFEKSLAMWPMFSAQNAAKAAKAETDAEAASDPDALTEMKKQLEAMQKQLDQLAGSRKP